MGTAGAGLSLILPHHPSSERWADRAGGGWTVAVQRWVRANRPSRAAQTELPAYSTELRSGTFEHTLNGRYFH
jgi:predicted NUDIX family NTP pyrophosphohydrolase